MDAGARLQHGGVPAHLQRGRECAGEVELMQNHASIMPLATNSWPLTFEIWTEATLFTIKLCVGYV